MSENIRKFASRIGFKSIAEEPSVSSEVEVSIESLSNVGKIVMEGVNRNPLTEMYLQTIERFSIIHNLLFPKMSHVSSIQYQDNKLSICIPLQIFEDLQLVKSINTLDEVIKKFNNNGSTIEQLSSIHKSKPSTDTSILIDKKIEQTLELLSVNLKLIVEKELKPMNDLIQAKLDRMRALEWENEFLKEHVLPLEGL